MLKNIKHKFLANIKVLVFLNFKIGSLYVALACWADQGSLEFEQSSSVSLLSGGIDYW